MIDLNLDLTYLMNRFEIKTQRVDQYANRSIEDLMDAEASNGNKKAANFDLSLQSPSEIAKIFKLSDPSNKLMIIRELSSSDLSALLKYLDNEDLVWGLKYLTREKLKDLVEALPQKELIKMVLDVIPLEEIIKQMPEEELNKFLESTKVERKDITNIFQNMKENELQKLLSQVFGKEAQDMNKDQMLGAIDNLGDNQFNNMIKSFQGNGKKFLTFNLIKNDPKLLFELEPKSLARPFMQQDQGQILRSIGKLDQKYIIPMVEELPDQLIQIIASQIKPDTFAEILSDNFADILKEVSL